MQDVRVVRDAGIFHYDAQVDGYTDGDIFATVSGTPAILSNELKVNAAEIASLQGVGLGELEFLMDIPTAPTAGDARVWGLKSLQGGDLGRISFEITDTTFQAIAYDEDGSELGSVVIPWDSDWTNTEVRYGIKRGIRSVFFTIDGDLYGQIPDVALSKRSLNISVDNDNSDNLLISSITVV